jgi:hypothetical protein
MLCGHLQTPLLLCHEGDSVLVGAVLHYMYFELVNDIVKPVLAGRPGALKSVAV